MDWQDVRRCCKSHEAADLQERARQHDSWTLGLGATFIVCSTCGNKRCPKATACALECTGSNEPGQSGSVY